MKKGDGVPIDRSETGSGDIYQIKLTIKKRVIIDVNFLEDF